MTFGVSRNEVQSFDTKLSLSKDLGTEYVFKSVKDTVYKLRSKNILNINDETKKRLKENEGFFGRQISKMYSKRNAPDYLIEDQPGESKVPCKPLIQKVKEDKSSVGLSGDQCMDEARIFFNEMMKKKEANERFKKERKEKQKFKKLQKEKTINDKLQLIKDPNTIILYDQVSAARATSAGRSSIMRTPESTELIVPSAMGIDSDLSKARQTHKGYIKAIMPKKIRNPNKQ